MNVYGYARVSSFRQIENTSIDSQCHAIAKRYPETVTYFKDEGVSGSIPLFERPQGAILRNALQKGDVIVLAKVDRGFRSLDDFAVTTKKLTSDGIGVAVLDLNGGAPLANDKFASAMLAMLVVFAELERRMIAERTAEGRLVMLRDGCYIGGRPPFGHSVGAEGVLLREAWYNDCVARARELSGKGYSLRQIRVQLETEFKQSPSLPTLQKLVKGSPTHTGAFEDLLS